MPSPRAAARPLLAALLLAVPLAACGGGPEPVASGDAPVRAEPDGPAVASSVDDDTIPQIISIVVTEGGLTGDTGVVEVKRNAPVRLSVISDDADTLLVGGYDLRATATADVPVQLEFLAAQPGEFPVVLEESGLELATLRVS